MNNYRENKPVIKNIFDKDRDSEVDKAFIVMMSHYIKQDETIMDSLTRFLEDESFSSELKSLAKKRQDEFQRLIDLGFNVNQLEQEDIDVIQDMVIIEQSLDSINWGLLS